MVDPLLTALVILAGLAAGVASGLFGVGGGILMVPAALYLIPGTGFHAAKAASLVVITVSSGIGVWTHARHRSVDFRKGLLLATTGVAGSALGVALAEQAGDVTLRILFGLVLVGAGARLAAPKQPEPRPRTAAKERALVLALGFGGGLLAGAFGVGGGILMVPGLALAGVGIHLAVGTSLVAVLANAAAGTLTHAAFGYGTALLALGIPLAIGAVPGVHLGSLLAHRLHANSLRRAFGVFLMIVGAGMAAHALA